MSNGSDPTEKNKAMPTLQSAQGGESSQMSQRTLNIAPSVAVLLPFQNSAVQQKQSITKSKPTLLGLPAELRNTIYEMALLKDDKILVNANPEVPGLMRVNRQLREEAGNIFYGQNRFVIDLYDLKIAPQTQHWIWKSWREGKHNNQVWGCNLKRNYNWLNLKEWMLLCHTGRVPGLPSKGVHRQKSKVVAQAFELMAVMERAGGKWGDIESALEVLKAAVDAKNRHWTFN